MEKGNNQNYDRDNRDFNQNIDTLINNEKAIEKDQHQNQEEFIDDINRQTNKYNRNENNPGEEPILNTEDQITNDQEQDDLDDEDNDDLKEEDDDDLDEDIDEVSHDPFPNLDPLNFKY